MCDMCGLCCRASFVDDVVIYGFDVGKRRCRQAGEDVSSTLPRDVLAVNNKYFVILLPTPVIELLIRLFIT